VLRPLRTGRPTSLRAVVLGLSLVGVGTLSVALGVAASATTLPPDAHLTAQPVVAAPAPDPGRGPGPGPAADPDPVTSRDRVTVPGPDAAPAAEVPGPRTEATTRAHPRSDPAPDGWLGLTSALAAEGGPVAAVDGWAAAPAAPDPGPAPAPASEPVAEPVARPVTVEVPAIGVRSDLIDLDLDADRRLEVPRDPDLAGWYVRGTRPGQHGPAVIAGHVDSTEGPAVFFRLGELQGGDRITVHREDGTAVAFAVDRVERWPKDAFPTDPVYREADGAELRLITCGGAFDEDTSSYHDNVIVFASEVSG
jgi:hypothetical protein